MDLHEALASFQEIIEENQTQQEQWQRELKEIDILIKQTTDEVEKLSQRNTQVANKVRQMEADLESYTRDDIKNLYTTSRETQMRLFMMRSQAEELQNKQRNLERFIGQLGRFIEVGEQLQQLLKTVEAQPWPEVTLASSRQQTIVRIIEAQESERQHLARQMHDGPAQTLTNLILQAEICERLFGRDPERAQIELRNLKNAVNATFQKMRDFIFDLRPMMLDDLGVLPTLRRYTQSFEEKHGIATHLSIMGTEKRFAPYTEVTLFRIIQELMHNAQQHAHPSHLQISVELQDETIVATVEDDGSGFDVAEVLDSKRPQQTIGISAIQERLEMLGGKIRFQSSLGRGTKVTVELPAV